MNVERKSNLELHALVDGELDAQSSQRVQSAIDSDPELAREFEAIKSLKQQFKDEFLELKTSETPAALINSVRDYQPVARTSSKRGMGWAAAACLIAGVFGGYLLGSQVSNQVSTQAANQLADTAEAGNWIEQVVNYHDMYTVATLEHVTSTEPQRQALLARLSKSMGQTLMIPEFAGTSLEFKRGQVLRSNGQPVIQLAYLDLDTGSPVAVCITADRPSGSGPENGEFKPGQAFGLNYVNWQNNGLDFLVVGPFNPSEMGKIADQVHDQFTEV